MEESYGDRDETSYPEREVRRVALAIVAGVFFGGVATGVAFPTLPLLDEALAITAVMLSVVLAANRIARLVMNTPAGSIIDRLGARTPMIFGLFTQALAPFGYVVGLHAPPIPLGALPVVGAVSLPGLVFVLARAVWGVGSAFVFIGAFATITHVTSRDNRGQWIGYVRGGQSLGFPTGLVLGGVLTDLADMQTAFLVAGVLALAAGVIAAFVLPDVRGADGEARTAKLRAVPGMVANSPWIVPIGFGNFTLRFLWGGVVLTTLVRYADVNALQLSALSAAGISGVVMGVGVVVSGGTTVASGWLSDRVRSRALLTVPSFVAFAAGFAVIASVPTIEALFASLVLMGLGMGGAAPALLAILGDITPGEELGRMGGVYNVFGDVGLSLGPLVAIPAVDLWLGYEQTYLLSGLLVLACLLVVSLPLVRRDVAALSPASG